MTILSSYNEPQRRIVGSRLSEKLLVWNKYFEDLIDLDVTFFDGPVNLSICCENHDINQLSIVLVDKFAAVWCAEYLWHGFWSAAPHSPLLHLSHRDYVVAFGFFLVIRWAAYFLQNLLSWWKCRGSLYDAPCAHFFSHVKPVAATSQLW